MSAIRRSSFTKRASQAGSACPFVFASSSSMVIGDSFRRAYTWCARRAFALGVKPNRNCFQMAEDRIVAGIQRRHNTSELLQQLRSSRQGGAPLTIANGFAGAIHQIGRGAVLSYARNDPAVFAVDGENLLGNEPDLNWHIRFMIGIAERARLAKRRLDGLADPPRRVHDDVGGHWGGSPAVAITYSMTISQ